MTRSDDRAAVACRRRRWGSNLPELAERLLHPTTYSIVACDLARREWGVAAASKFLAIGALSTWAEPEVGAIATQSWIKASYGDQGLRLLAEGASASETLDRLVAEDDGREQRQVGVVDREGRTASYTGAACLEWAGERHGPSYTSQGNMLVSGDTLAALAETFEATASEPLVERLIAGLEAAQAAGGDRRGQQAAAVRVVRQGGGYLGADVLVDLRVDDHRQPISELERLYGLHQLYFGSTSREQWLPVDDELAAELRERLDRLGYVGGKLAADLDTWAGVENLEDRVEGVDRIDPVVLGELRKRWGGVEGT
ncbi:MAG: DUF1028 domain-containing protein [Thermoleophilaceae bacterium]|nr:DUF1028 domain-containing protein [Thermoleophilaceae bacterium]